MSGSTPKVPLLPVARLRSDSSSEESGEGFDKVDKELTGIQADACNVRWKTILENKRAKSAPVTFRSSKPSATKASMATYGSMVFPGVATIKAPFIHLASTRTPFKLDEEYVYQVIKMMESYWDMYANLPPYSRIFRRLVSPLTRL